MNKSNLIAALFTVVAAVALYNQQTPANGPYSFQQYQTEFGKVYSKAGEQEYRKTVFLRNIDSIA